MTFGINLFDIYRSPNIGIFLKANDRFCLVPRGLAPTKSTHISELLSCEAVQISIAGSRLIGPLAVMNGKGIIVSRLAEDEEIETLKRITGLKVERLTSRFTSAGNLIAANDTGAIVADIIGDEGVHTVEATLGVPVTRMRIADHVQIGAMMGVTNRGAIVHPSASESELEVVRKSLRVEPEPATVNGGVPFVGSAFVGNTNGILLGNMTRGGELVIISRAFTS